MGFIKVRATPREVNRVQPPALGSDVTKEEFCPGLNLVLKGVLNWCKLLMFSSPADFHVCAC